jgi:hypothetical protein
LEVVWAAFPELPEDETALDEGARNYLFFTTNLLLAPLALGDSCHQGKFRVTMVEA